MPPSKNSAGQMPWMVRIVLRTGFVETRKQAEAVLLGIALLCSVVALWTFFSDDRPTARPEDDPNYEPASARG